MELAPEQRLAGVLAPLFALRSESDLGIGDTRTLRDFVSWAAKYGFRLVQLLPINETGNDHSPYNAVSSIAIDPVTLALSPADLEDLSPSAFEEIVGSADLSHLRAGPVLYPEVKRLKRRLLEAAFCHFWENHHGKDTDRAIRFQTWRREQEEWLSGYVLFRALMEANGGDERWDLWPKEQQTEKTAREWLRRLDANQQKEWERRLLYYGYVQWIAFEQWQAVKRFCDEQGVALMGDVPIGVSYYGADFFSEPELFDKEWSGGAPPERHFKTDPFTEKWGQNWGVPIYRWDVHRVTNYRWWRQRVRQVREIFHLFRIDHVLGFYRMYGFPWRPSENETFLPLTEEEARAKTGGALPHFIPRDDSTWENSEANRQEGEHALQALSEEVGPFRLIGEDLGVVPPYVRPSLTSLGIAGFKIPHWERGSDWNLVRGEDYQRLSLATYATHDHLPLAALWKEKCEAVAAGDGHQRWELEQLCGFAGMAFHGPGPFTHEIHEGLLNALFECNAWLAVVMITDLFGSEKRFNVPGAVAATNWSERLNRTVAQWETTPDVAEKMERIAQLVKRGGRA